MIWLAIRAAEKKFYDTFEEYDYDGAYAAISITAKDLDSSLTEFLETYHYDNFESYKRPADDKL